MARARYLVLRIRPDFPYSYYSYPKRRAPSFTSLPRYRSVFIAFLFWVVTVIILLHVHQPWIAPGFSDGAERMPFVVRKPPLSERVPCYGARGVLLSNSSDDELRYGDLDDVGMFFALQPLYPHPRWV